MSGTRRTPLDRPSAAMQITERAIDLFEAMGKLRCTCLEKPGRVHPDCSCSGCERWYDLLGDLDEELGCAPWQWPCVGRQGPKHAGSTCWNDDIAARMAALKAAAKARRATAPSARKEEDATNAEPVAGREPVAH